MTKTYYLDTCIWRDFYEDRFGQEGRPLGMYATRLVMKILKNKNQILYSEALIRELKKAYAEDQINDMLNLLFLNNVLVRIEITREEYKEARKISQQRDIPLVDCLNAVQARNHGAVVISQDKHFSDLRDIAQVSKPQHII
ncbi:MAG: PIN domain-containing protein [Candidatus Woesearchaeota archaeon]